MCLLRIFSTKTRQTNAPTPSQVQMRSESNLAWCRIFTFEKSDVRTKFLLSIFENHIPVQNTIKQMPPTKLSLSKKEIKLDLVKGDLSNKLAQ
jgi:hypothetical protein